MHLNRFVSFLFLFGLFFPPPNASAVGIFKVSSGDREVEFQMASGKLIADDVDTKIFYAGEKLLLVGPDRANFEIAGRRSIANAGTHVVTLSQAKTGFLEIIVGSGFQDFYGRIRLREPTVVFRSEGQEWRMPLSQAIDPKVTNGMFKPGAKVEAEIEPAEAGPMVFNGVEMGPGAAAKIGPDGAAAVETPAMIKNPENWVKLSSAEAKKLAGILKKSSAAPNCGDYIQNLEMAGRGEQEAWAQVRGPVEHMNSCSTSAQKILPEIIAAMKSDDEAEGGAKSAKKPQPAKPAAMPSESVGSSGPTQPAAAGI